ncbi:MAG: DUF4846 domain-containing protein [Polyangiaceae bacterium]
MSRLPLLLCVLALGACEPDGTTRPPSRVATAELASRDDVVEPAPSVEVPAASTPVDLDAYPWHTDETIEPLAAVDHLEDRFAPPSGYVRVAVKPDGFGAWLRRIPLAAAGTPVLAHDGRTILPEDHTHLAAVTTLDVGSRDLQQCADAIMRLFGEWRWSRGEARTVSFRSGFGAIPWTRFLSGEIPHYDGERVHWVTARRRAGEDHASFRRYMDVVFTWANTGSLASQASTPSEADLRPGDFFILPGNPGHTVLVLDLARDDQGRRVALIGQSFMPAQRFQVLRPSRDRVWFSIDDQGVDTPFWRPFPWSSLRRLDGP